MTTMVHDDLLHPDVIADPHTYFQHLRDTDPVHWNHLWNGWVMTRYDDVAAAFQDPRLSADRITPSLNRLSPGKLEERRTIYTVLSKWMAFNDPPIHTRLRMLMNKAFTPKAISRLEPRIGEIADQLLTQLDSKTQVDVVSEFAYLVPVLVIADLLGIPVDDRDLIKGWSDDLMLLVFGAVDVSDRHARAEKGLQEMHAYLSQMIEDRREHPKDDLLSSIAAASEGEDVLTTDEAVAMCTLLLFAGHETTTNLIANGVLTLLRNPAELARLRQDASLLPSAVEEILRFEGPSKSLIRIAKESFELRGKSIQEGQRVLLVQAAANRDGEQFDHPNRFDVARSPNSHLGFGRGIHYCLGAPLARLEGEIAIGRLIARFASMHLGETEVQWQPTLINRSLKQLLVEVHA